MPEPPDFIAVVRTHTQLRNAGQAHTDALLDAWQAGATVRELATLTGMSRSAMDRFLRDARHGRLRAAGRPT